MKPFIFAVTFLSMTFSVRADFFYCYAQSIEGDNYYYSPIFQGQFEQLECYQKSFDDYLEKTKQYSFRPACTLDGSRSLLSQQYKEDMLDSTGVFGQVEILSWTPLCADTPLLNQTGQ